jgi:hypothetical protein
MNRFNAKRIRKNHWSVGHGTNGVLFNGKFITYINLSFVLDEDEGRKKKETIEKGNLSS